MPQSEFIPLEYRDVSSKNHSPASIHLRSTNDSPEFNFSFQAVKPNLFRVTFSSSTHPIPPYPSVAKPQDALDDVQWTKSKISDSCQITEIGDVRASIEWSGTPVVSLSWKDSTEILHSDLKTRSYVSDGTGIAHYTQHDRNALHVGLGEKAAPMDLTGRHFQIATTDCFGYDVYRTDPMYKHIPLLIKATPHGCVAMFSTTHSRGTWAVGSEMDGHWGHFKVYRQDYGGLEEYLLVGRTIKDVIRTYAELVGFPLLNPKWAYGYISGGYKYTMGDDPPAYQLLLDFADKLVKHDIPCSAHQMSSGYSIAEEEPKVRNVFTWNSHRFPNPEKWIDQYHALGIRMITNIKPYVLNSHPDYQYLKEAGALFTDNRTKKTADMKLWSAGSCSNGNGSHIDFTSAAAFDWWRRGVKRLKRMGVDGMWNDNNEYPLPNDDWLLKLDNPMTKCDDLNVENTLGLWGRSMHTELMGKASHDGLLEAEPDIRPFVLSRSATAGTLRYACSTWSGDNVTSWESMKGATALSLTAGMSLLQNFGHDIGGFEGKYPSHYATVQSTRSATKQPQPPQQAHSPPQSSSSAGSN
jgi:alpha-glucosidase (family GH31 glycosyl hydrolase)